MNSEIQNLSGNTQLVKCMRKIFFLNFVAFSENLNFIVTILIGNSNMIFKSLRKDPNCDCYIVLIILVISCLDNSTINVLSFHALSKNDILNYILTQERVGIYLPSFSFQKYRKSRCCYLRFSYLMLTHPYFMCFL